MKIKVIKYYPQGIYGLPEEGLLLLVYSHLLAGIMEELMLSECLKTFRWNDNLYPLKMHIQSALTVLIFVI